ncbi:MAG: eukaryotic translation initiation factor 3 subunit D [archaeon]|nr:eukaryotic translation initiation factor 3 subunit D [archaeon]
MASHFVIPDIKDNLDGGWGPSRATPPVLPASLVEKAIPYAPYNKSARLGRITDWNNTSYNNRAVAGVSRVFGREAGAYGRGGGGAGRSDRDDFPRNEAFFDRTLIEDTADFQLVVDEKRSNKKKRATGPPSSRYRFGGRRGGNLGRVLAAAQAEPDQPRGKASKHGFKPQKGKRQELARQRWTSYSRWGGGAGGDREPSVAVKDTWELAQQFDFESLRGKPEATTASAGDQKPEDLASAGELYYFTGPHLRKEQILAKRFVVPDSLPRIQTTSADAIMNQLAADNQGNVFITDELLSVLMTAECSVYPWDLVFTRRGTQLFVDKRGDSNLNYDTVNETANEQPRDDPNNPTPMESTSDINAPAPLALEATRINANFQHQVLSIGEGPEPLRFDRPNPFESETSARVSRAYRYRRWVLGDNLRVVVRCTLDGVRTHHDQTEHLIIRSLNEFDPRSDGINWRTKLGTQPGAIIATEMKSNASKLSRWLIQASLSGANQVLLGFVSRGTSKSNTTHVVLGQHLYRPHELVSQLSLDLNRSWNIFANIASFLLSKPEGKYCLVRESNTPGLSIFSVPIDEDFQKIEARPEEIDSLSPQSSSSTN